MEVILLKKIDKVGGANEIVKVKDGYGRNYLIPQRLAIIANKTNRARLSEQINQYNRQQGHILEQAQEIAGKLKDVVLKIGAKAGTSGKIFGSVTNIQLSQAIQEQVGLEIDRKTIKLPEEVKMLGSYVAEVNLHSDVECKLNFEVVAD